MAASRGIQRKPQPPFAFLQHLGGSGGANPGDTDRPDFEQRIQRAHAAGRLDPDGWRQMLAHQLDIFGEGAAAGESSGGFGKIHASSAQISHNLEDDLRKLLPAR
jgi:hypothetical protein